MTQTTTNNDENLFLLSTEDDNKYTHPSLNFTEGWDMVASAELEALNKAFNYFYSKFTDEQKIFSIQKDIEVNDKIVPIKLSFKLPDITFTGLSNGVSLDDTVLSVKLFFSEMTATMENIEVDDTKEDKIEFNIPNVEIIAKFVLQNVITTTEYQSTTEELKVKFIPNEKTLIEAQISTGTPEFKKPVMKIIWIGLIEILNESIIPEFISSLEIDEYDLFTVIIATDKYNKIMSFIPTYAKYDGSDYNNGAEEKSLLCIFAETINKIDDKQLLSKITKNFIPNQNDDCVISLSAQVVLDGVIRPLLNEKLKDRNITFNCCCDNDGAYLITSNTIEINQDHKEIKIDNIHIRFIDNGIHINGDITVVCAKISKIKGTFMMNGLLYKDPNSGDYTIKFNDPYVDANLSLNIIGKVIELLLGLSGIGLIVDLLGNIVIAILNIILEFSPESLPINFKIPSIPISWNNLSMAKVSSIEISDGVKVSAKLKISESSN